MVSTLLVQKTIYLRFGSLEGAWDIGEKAKSHGILPLSLHIAYSGVVLLEIVSVDTIFTKSSLLERFKTKSYLNRERNSLVSKTFK